MGGRRSWAGATTALTTLSTLLALLAFLWVGNGIAYSGGAEFALILCGIALLCSLPVLLAPAWPRTLHGVSAILMLGCLIAAAVAAYFLTAWAVLAAVLLSILCWIGLRLARPDIVREAWA